MTLWCIYVSCLDLRILIVEGGFSFNCYNLVIASYPALSYIEFVHVQSVGSKKIDMNLELIINLCSVSQTGQLPSMPYFIHHLIKKGYQVAG